MPPRTQVQTEDIPEDIELTSDRPLPNERLAVTSKLHPFWRTKNGLAIVALVILVFIGAIVGGAIGGKQAGRGSNSKNNSAVKCSSIPPTTTISSNM
jgi:hypothetical protein